MEESTDGVLLVQLDDGVVTLTLNRPEQLNAFDEELHVRFARFWADIEDDERVRAVVLTGAGRAFCAGGNVADFPRLHADLAARNKLMRSARRLVMEMLDVRVPVIAAVNGPAVGLGSTLASLCDIVFIAETTFIADPHVAVALVAGDGGAVTWPANTSLLKAKQYLLTGDRVPAADAVAIGIANFAVPAADVITEATAFARRLAALPPQAVQDTKLLLNQHLRQSAVATLGYGLAAETHSHDTPEFVANG